MRDPEDPIPQASRREPWNKGKLTGAKPPLRPKHVWSIRSKLQIEGRTRDLAMFNLAIAGMCRFGVGARSTGWRCMYRLFVEPDVFHARAIGDAVDHYRQTLHIRLPAGRAAIVKDDRSGAVLRQFPLDLPH